ncbi:TetR/AcrR family transcriptional regulator [Nocardia terpenica]|uniref:TetR family transcriptional regulator n=1 Tax=Nocardia terpenica TaxID=455432 RepID=A0A164JDE0_9NOCA|nr:TetR/AcrR family transcriptional regulator [Nocardia terpenica]KZM70292.1 TetR family transcriptional regulator [Nocardia terpenica]MBF6064045.1 TetR/AcrR family transcriptional regulator [Nocardia terpenica]MBF6107719.1 TetR/AcrR family transcriptional regulator [Nocardia terpenica]MBF6114787.1 TetR/AcrR family transcriptional regulator [Nocardia terpenica]MBF6121226.1 TetR/AcrR family transcriptional regulator [Nocardia terpenica]
MPRGVAIPEIRQQLFAAAERVILRDGPSKLGGRAVTGEAGVATGLLYAHFSDLDGFLTSFAVDRAFVISAEVATLPERAGRGDIVATVCEAVLATPLVTVMAVTRLLVARPELNGRVREVLGARTGGLEAIESAAAAYLAAEQRLGRIAATAAPEPLSHALVGSVHYTVLRADSESLARERIRQVVAAVLAGFVTTAARR